MLRVSPVGLAAAPVVNQLSLLLTFREKLCKPFCIDSSLQPSASVVYSTGTPVLNDTTVFVPVTARITITSPSCGCNATSQLYTEQFYVAFQGQTEVPLAVQISSVGTIQGGSVVACGKALAYSLNDSVTISI
jgi:hypothetical protein